MVRMVCMTPESIVETIAAMGAAGVTDFELIVPSALYEELSADRFAALEKLETQAGVRSRNLGYQMFGKHLIQYTEADIVSDVVQVATLQEAIDYVTLKAHEKADQITMFCTEELFTELMGNISEFVAFSDNRERIYDLASLSGIFDYTVSYNSS